MSGTPSRQRCSPSVLLRHGLCRSPRTHQQQYVIVYLFDCDVVGQSHRALRAADTDSHVKTTLSVPTFGGMVAAIAAFVVLVACCAKRGASTESTVGRQHSSGAWTQPPVGLAQPSVDRTGVLKGVDVCPQGGSHHPVPARLAPSCHFPACVCLLLSSLETFHMW